MAPMLVVPVIMSSRVRSRGLLLVRRFLLARYESHSTLRALAGSDLLDFRVHGTRVDRGAEIWHRASRTAGAALMVGVGVRQFALPAVLAPRLRAENGRQR